MDNANLLPIRLSAAFGGNYDRERAIFKQEFNRSVGRHQRHVGGLAH